MKAIKSAMTIDLNTTVSLQPRDGPLQFCFYEEDQILSFEFQPSGWVKILP